MNQTFILSKPLNINVAEIASFIPGCRYTKTTHSEYIMRQDYSWILCFDDKNDKGYTKIRTDCTPEELSRLFKRFPTELSTQLKQALVGFQLEVPSYFTNYVSQLSLQFNQFFQSSLPAPLKIDLSSHSLEDKILSFEKNILSLLKKETLSLGSAKEDEKITKTPELKYFKQGPLEKTVSTEVLEGIIHDFCNKANSHTFTINNDGLILTIQDIKYGKYGRKTEYNLNFLLTSANLTHINIKQDFLDLYLQKMDTLIVKKLGLKSQKEFEELCAERQSMTKEQKELGLAHRFAIFNYTKSALSHRFNEFLKGNLEFLSGAARKFDSEYFQAVAFYTLSTLVILADALSKLKPAHDEAKKEIVSEKAFRFEIHRAEKLDRNLILNGIKEAGRAKTNTFLVKEPVFISTSEGQLKFSNALDPVPFTTDKMVYVIIFENEPKKPIYTLSQYLSENELLLSPTDVSYTILLQEGPYVLLSAKTLAPLDTVAEDSHMIRMALRHVAEKLGKEFKHSSPHDCDHQLILGYGRPPIQRPNHGLAHAARQSKNIMDVLDFILKNSTGDTQLACQFLKNNKMILNLVQVAALFLSVGRENEKSGNEDFNEYLSTRRAARDAFEKYLQDNLYFYAKSLGTDVELLEATAWCANAIENLGSVPYMQSLAKKNQPVCSLIYHLLTAAHLLDTPRCFPFETCKVILEKRLFSEVGGALKHSTKIDEELQSLWDISLSRIRKTGDRIIKAKNYSSPHTYPFYETSTSPEFCEKILNLYEPQKTIYPLPPVKISKKMQECSEEAAFNLLFYLFSINTNPGKQVTYFIDPKMTNLLNLAVRHIQKMKKEECDDDKVKKFIASMQIRALTHIQYTAKMPNDFFKTLLNWLDFHFCFNEYLAKTKDKQKIHYEQCGGDFRFFENSSLRKNKMSKEILTYISNKYLNKEDSMKIATVCKDDHHSSKKMKIG